MELDLFAANPSHEIGVGARKGITTEAGIGGCAVQKPRRAFGAHMRANPKQIPIREHQLAPTDFDGLGKGGMRRRGHGGILQSAETTAAHPALLVGQRRKRRDRGSARGTKK